MKCLKHFAHDLQDLYDEWIVRRDEEADSEIVIPRIGHSTTVEAVENIEDHVEGKRFENMYVRIEEAVKAAIAREREGRGGGASAWAGTGRRVNSGESGGVDKKAKRRINGARIPADSKGRRICVTNSESSGCKMGTKCKWSQERTLSKEEMDHGPDIRVGRQVVSQGEVEFSIRMEHQRI